MNLKGGVIVIGSLLWDNSPIRMKWRNLCLDSLNNKITVPLKICYGRQSQSRGGTFTMMLSNHPAIGWGQGYILPFKESVQSFLQLEKQAQALAQAEGIWKDASPYMASKWGAVGLLINPKFTGVEHKLVELIRQRWKDLYSRQQKYDTTLFKIDNEPTTIDQSGFLQIGWVEQMNDFDFLLATPVEPNPKRLIESKEIAEKANDYFKNNRELHITTFQDEEILKSMQQH